MPPSLATLRHLLGRLFADRAAASNPFEGKSQARLVGLRDAVASGWFRAETGEIFTGFAVERDDVLLDAGCGNGAIAEFCAQRGAHVIFADIDPARVEATARLLAKSPARALTPLVSDGNPLPLEDGIATKVISLEVLEHVDDPARFLRELVRVGRPGARYLLSVPDPVQEALQRQLAPAAFFEKPDPARPTLRGLSSGHLRTFERDAFEALVEGAGLVIEERAASGFFWSLWFAFFWISEIDFDKPEHPLLAEWTETWHTLLDMPEGAEVKRVLDEFMPKSQILLARKP